MNIIMDIRVGDKVQIKNGAIDVTNGNYAVEGKNYGINGPLWATVTLIDEIYETSGRYGLPAEVTRVRCESDEGIIVWQVQKDGIGRVIHASDPDIIQTDPNPVVNYDTTYTGELYLNDVSDKEEKVNVDVSSNKREYYSNEYFAPHGGTNDLVASQGIKTYAHTPDILPKTSDFEPIIGFASSMDQHEVINYPRGNEGWRELNKQEKKSIGSPNIIINESAIVGSTSRTVFQNPNKRRELLREDVENIQNDKLFPYMITKSNELMSAKYDYQIIPGDIRYKSSKTLEDKLQQIRATLGIHVHGSNEIARAVKYYMYNRFKVPDSNLAHSKSFTYIFFTRPDCNLLTTHTYGLTANNQVKNNTSSYMLWKLHPDLFKLLTNSGRCGDADNFNLLLSNQIKSFSIIDENLIINGEVGKSWNGHSMSYGTGFEGKSGGEFTCSFDETSDYSIINLMKLWVTYIENVASGEWSPSYNLKVGNGVSIGDINDSHVYTKTLDYAGAAYVFKCGPDGEDVLYWSKYYGVFPINTGSDILSWESGSTDISKLNIKFRYCFKEDLDPISLIEFNEASGFGDFTYTNAYNVNIAQVARPFVGAPFIECKLPNPKLKGNGIQFQKENGHIRLKFKKVSDTKLTDQLLYRFDMSQRDVMSKFT